MNDSVVFMNLNSYPVAITDERGMSIAMTTGKAVKGDYFAVWAAPRGPLSMVHESQVAPGAVVYEAKPWALTDEAKWAESKKKYDPAIFDVPAAHKADTKADIVSESDEDGSDTASIRTSETDNTEKRKKKK